MLKTIKYIKEYGLENLIETYSLIHKDYGHKFLLKYSQIDSPMSEEIVQECRGLILSKNLDIISYPLSKFFNHGEGPAATIDMATAKTLEKIDGTFIHLYYDWVLSDWCVGTTGTAEAEGTVNLRLDTTFSGLFWETIENVYVKFDKLNLIKTNVYMFELTTPYNQVVKVFKEPSLTLLSIRDLLTLKEFAYEDLEFFYDTFGIPLVKRHDLSCDYSTLVETFKDMPYSEEGYVVVDDQHRRLKIKNPAYVAAHHLKSSCSPYNMLELVKTNEVSEFIVIYPEVKDEINDLMERFKFTLWRLELAWELLRDSRPTDLEDRDQMKAYAELVHRKVVKWGLKDYTGLFFALANGKVDSIREYMVGVPNKELYKRLKKYD